MGSMVVALILSVDAGYARADAVQLEPPTTGASWVPSSAEEQRTQLADFTTESASSNSEHGSTDDGLGLSVLVAGASVTLVGSAVALALGALRKAWEWLMSHIFVRGTSRLASLSKQDGT